MKRLWTRRNRQWLYAITSAAIPLLIAYGIITASSAPLWLTLAAAVLGTASPVVALGHLTPDPEQG